MIENRAGGSQEGTGGRRTKRNKLTLFFKQKRVGPSGLTPGWATGFGGRERGRLFALTGVWDDGAGGSRMSSSHCSAEQLQQEWERLLGRLNKGNDSVSFYSC